MMLIMSDLNTRPDGDTDKMAPNPLTRRIRVPIGGFRKDLERSLAGHPTSSPAPSQLTEQAQEILQECLVVGEMVKQDIANKDPQAMEILEIFRASLERRDTPA
jgi:hypothetical protein